MPRKAKNLYYARWYGADLVSARANVSFEAWNAEGACVRANKVARELRLPDNLYRTITHNGHTVHSCHTSISP